MQKRDLSPTVKDIKEEGFSILEVLVTILVISGFLLGSLKATVLSVLLRVQAQDKQEAANWIQQDLELIRYEAFMFDRDPTTGEYSEDVGTCGTYGDDLSSEISLITNPVSINNKNYTVTRTATGNSNILTINYTVAYATDHPRFRSEGNNDVTTLSTEVIPSAALSC